MINKFKSKITNIQTIDNLNIVSFDFKGISLKMMSLELNKNIQINTKVYLSVKATNIAIAKEFIGSISYSNQIDAKVIDIQKGKLLSSLTLNTNDVLFESVITTSSLIRMDINTNDYIIAFIKASDLYIQEVCDE